MFSLYYLLLQSIPEKAVSITNATDSGSNALLMSLLTAIAGAAGGWLVRSLIIKPGERVEQYEAAEMKAIKDNFSEFKQMYRQNATEWNGWRENAANRITTLELQTRNLQEQLSEKIKSLTADVAETKEITQDIREALAGLKVQMENTIGKWTK